MPCDLSTYPATWQQTRATIAKRSRGQCECTGQCGKHQPAPLARRCCELHGKAARWFNGRVRLALAHLCKCSPPCDNPCHIIHACQKCHLRIDRFEHARKRLVTQQKNTSLPPPKMLQ